MDGTWNVPTTLTLVGCAYDAERRTTKENHATKDSRPRKHDPHITLIHPRNGICTDSIFEEIASQMVSFSTTFRSVALIEQFDGAKWRELIFSPLEAIPWDKAGGISFMQVAMISGFNRKSTRQGKSNGNVSISITNTTSASCKKHPRDFWNHGDFARCLVRCSTIGTQERLAPSAVAVPPTSLCSIARITATDG